MLQFKATKERNECNETIILIDILADFFTNPDVGIVKEVAQICPAPERSKHVDGKKTYGKPRQHKYEIGSAEVPDVRYF